MTTVYGLPAVEVPQPDGGSVGYLCRAVATFPREWAAWLVVSPKGDEYRVTEWPSGLCSCSCPAFKWNRHEAGRWCDANGMPACKHIASVWTEIIRPSTEGDDDAG